LPICVDGTYPKDLQAIDTERKKSELSSCKESIVHGVTHDGYISGKIEFNNCPKNGAARLYYSGTCKELGAGQTATIKEFPFDKNGHLSIQLLLPKVCVNKKKSTNKWEVALFERQQTFFPKEMIGTNNVSW
jgi:hypothetical protein